MKQSSNAVITYCFKNYDKESIAIPKKEGAKGFLIYDTITDLSQIKRLAKACKYAVIVSEPEYVRGVQVSPARAYIGPVTKKDISTDSLFAHLMK